MTVPSCNFDIIVARRFARLGGGFKCLPPLAGTRQYKFPMLPSAFQMNVTRAIELGVATTAKAPAKTQRARLSGAPIDLRRIYDGY